MTLTNVLKVKLLFYFFQYSLVIYYRLGNCHILKIALQEGRLFFSRYNSQQLWQSIWSNACGVYNVVRDLHLSSDNQYILSDGLMHYKSKCCHNSNIFLIP